MSLITRFNREPFKVIITIPGVGEAIGRGATFGEAHERALSEVEDRRRRATSALKAVNEAYSALIAVRP